MIKLKRIQKKDINFLCDLIYLDDSHLWLNTRPSRENYYSHLIFKIEVENYHYIICKGTERIGCIFLNHIDFPNKNAAISCYIIKQYRNSLIGYFAYKELINYAFETLNLNKLYFDIYDFNNSSLQMMHKLKFNIEGTLYNHKFLNNKFYTLFKFSLFKDEWAKLRKKYYY